MRYVRIVGGDRVPFGVTPQSLFHQVAPVCWPWPAPDALLAEYDIYPAEAGDPDHTEELV